jgi:CO/xanthine dehydrogenase FAD-binding subunit
MWRFEYLRAKDLNEALRILRGEEVYPIAGGTNLLADIRSEAIRPRAVLDIGFLPELRELNHQDGKIEMGPCLTMTEITNAPMIKSKAPILSESAGSVGGPQIRNRATPGGNIVSASPAADTVVSLVALGAEVTLHNATAKRTVLLEDLFVEPGRTKIKREELLTRISFQALSPEERSVFFKLGRRNAMAISVVNLAIVAANDGAKERWRSVRIVLGAVASTVIRARKAEAFLCNRRIERSLFREASRLAALECSPISDIRASAEYRKAMVEVLVEDGLTRLAGSF